MVAMAEGLLHYFPWRVLLKGKKLPRVAAYTLGTLAMMAPLTAWLWEQGQTVKTVDVIETLWVSIFTAGLTVLALYGLDRYLKLEIKDQEHNEQETLRREQDGTQS
jgi:hypothetical protein